MFDIKNKIVVITGAACGIGANIVRIILQEEVKCVTILDIDVKNGLAMEEELNEKHGSNKVKFIKCDVTQERDLVDAFTTVKDEQGYIDVVINSAGLLNDKNFVKEIDINLTALIRVNLYVWDFIRKDEGGKGGTIINIASIAAIVPSPVVPVYSATKSAVVKFSNALGDEMHYSRTGIRVLTICFGLTKTQMVTQNVRSFDLTIEEYIRIGLETLKLQTTEQAARGLTEVYKNGRSGSVWLVVGGDPAVDVTEVYLQSAQTFKDLCYK